MEIKIFDRWSTKGIEVLDPGLKNYINLVPSIVPKTGGKYRRQFHKSKKNIVERLITKLMVPGHRGKRHRITSGRVVGKYITNYNIVKETFEKIENVTKKNPIEVFVRAIENVSLREEIANYQIGGIIVRRAVITSPQRRVDVALKNIAQAAYKKSFGKKEKMSDVLANEIIGSYNNDKNKSEAVSEKERIEREAEGAR
jgi:small subunit ribosomal protein S7